MEKQVRTLFYRDIAIEFEVEKENDKVYLTEEGFAKLYDTMSKTLLGIFMLIDDYKQPAGVTSIAPAKSTTGAQSTGTSMVIPTMGSATPVLAKTAVTSVSTQPKSRVPDPATIPLNDGRAWKDAPDLCDRMKRLKKYLGVENDGLAVYIKEWSSGMMQTVNDLYPACTTMFLEYMVKETKDTRTAAVA